MPIQLMQKLRAIQMRLQWIAFCRKFLTLLALGEAIIFAYILFSRLLPHPYGPEVVGPYFGGAWLLSLIVWAFIGRIKLFEAAIRADEDLGLKERLSSALMIRQPREAAEMAVLEDAAICAQNIRPSRQFPMRLGREFKFALGPLVPLILLCWLMPQLDLWAKRGPDAKKLDPAIAIKSEAQKEASKELEQIAQSLKDQESKLQDSPFMKQAERELKELAKMLEDKKVNNEEAMAKMAKLGDKMADRKSELEKKLDKMSDLKELGEGKMTREVQKALANGNFEKAAQEMEKLQEKMQNGQLSEEEKKGLQEEMKKLAEKMQKQAGEETEMSKALKEAAQKMAEGKTAEAMAKMDQAKSEMQASAEMMQELSEMESMEGDMKAQQDAMKKDGKEGNCSSCGKPGTKGSKCGECESKDGKKQAWKPGDERKEGKGLGGPGIGEGGIMDKEDGEVGFKKEQVKGDFTAGKIIAKMKVDGEQNIGEITTDYEDLRLQYEQKAEDSIQREMLPLEHKALVREYFDAIKEQQAGGEKVTGEEHDHEHDHAAEPKK